MTEQELRAWALAISALIWKSGDVAGLIKSSEIISNYIKTGDYPPKKE
jgi:hypothetical protein